MATKKKAAGAAQKKGSAARKGQGKPGRRSKEVTIDFQSSARSIPPQRFKGKDAMDLKKAGGRIDAKELADILKKLSTARVGFIILNAPFRAPRIARP